MTVLLIGRRAFAAQGFAARLRAAGYDVLETSAATFDDDPTVRASSPDAIVDFGFLRGAGVAANVARAERMIVWAREKGVRHIIHISSMSVYPSAATHIDAMTEPERDTASRGPYSSVKIAQENVHRAAAPHPYALTIVRPGVVIAREGDGFVCLTGGVWKRLAGRFGLLLGAPGSALPVVDRAFLHARLAAWLDDPPPPGATVAHILATPRTKGWFARLILGVRYVAVPETVARLAAAFLPRARAAQLCALYRTYELTPDEPSGEGVPA